MNSNDLPKNDKSVEFLYGSRIGKIILEFMLFIQVPKLLGIFLRSPMSRSYIKTFIKKNGIDMSHFQDYIQVNPQGSKKFKSFNDFFTRTLPADQLNPDQDRNHLISPSDSFLSIYKITEDAKFHIKGFDYSLEDFFDLKKTKSQLDVKKFIGGTCLVFRLCATDYHRYCYIDDGKHCGQEGKNHFLHGKLYSVQPKACENFRLYTKNRRSWTILETENFGKVAQIEVGAFSVGGIVNKYPGKNEEASFKKGEEKGYFDLHGSTIVLLFEKDRIKLKEEILQASQAGEVRVKYGQWIGNKS